MSSPRRKMILACAVAWLGLGLAFGLVLAFYLYHTPSRHGLDALSVAELAALAENDSDPKRAAAAKDRLQKRSVTPGADARLDALHALYRLDPPKTIPGLFVEMEDEWQRVSRLERDSESLPYLESHKALENAIAYPKPSLDPERNKRLEEAARNDTHIDFWFYGTSPDDDALIPFLIGVLEDPDRPEDHYFAAGLIGRYGRKANGGIPALTRLVGRSRLGLRNYSVDAIRKIGLPEASAAIPALKAILKNTKLDAKDSVEARMDARDRLAAALALIAFNQETDVVIDSLIAVVSSPYRYETRSTSYPGEARPEAAKVLGDLAPASKKAIPALAEVLGSEVSADLRLECAIALSKFGREAESAVPALKRYVTPRYTPHASDGPVREAAAEALRKIAPDEVK